MTQIDKLFTQIAKFVLNQPDLSFLRGQTIVRQHTEKLAQTGDIGFPTTIQPWLNAIKNADQLKDFKQIINENEDEFARKLIEISANWMYPIETVKFLQFRCLLFLNRMKCYSGILKTVLYDDASYGQWHHENDTNYAVQLVKQSSDNSLVEHRCMLIAKVLKNVLKMSGFQTMPYESDVNLVEILVTHARSAKRANRQTEIELNNNSDTKSKLIICGSVTTRPGLKADDFIR